MQSFGLGDISLTDVSRSETGLNLVGIISKLRLIEMWGALVVRLGRRWAKVG